MRKPTGHDFEAGTMSGDDNRTAPRLDPEIFIGLRVCATDKQDREQYRTVDHDT